MAFGVSTDLGALGFGARKTDAIILNQDGAVLDDVFVRASK
jgi:hypothetical protein